MPPNPIVRTKQKAGQEIIIFHFYLYEGCKDTLKIKSVRYVEDRIFQSPGFYHSGFQVVFVPEIFFVSGGVHTFHGELMRYLIPVHPVAKGIVGKKHRR